jgi:hypothetical protein
VDEPRDFVKEAGQWLKTPEPLDVLLTRERDQAVSWLVQILRQPDQGGGGTYPRKYAAFVLGQIGATESLETLQTARDQESVRGVREAMDAAIVALRSCKADSSLTEIDRRRIVQNVYDGKPPMWSGEAESPSATTETGTTQKSGGCWIATAAYGANSPEVAFLQAFRDRELQSRGLGRFLVSLYYRTSPPLARLMSSSRLLEQSIRRLVLAPALRLLGFKQRPRE